MSKTFYFIGRPDGIGNRVEELIKIQEYCEVHNMKCIYIWRNTSFRNYSVSITFENIEIRSTITPEEQTRALRNVMQRTFGHKVKYNFTFQVDNDLNYDIIIHLRATDRITFTDKHKDFSTIEMFNSFINKTIEYVNNDNSVSTYTIVTDDIRYKEKVKKNINKEYVELLYNSNVHKDWLDFYYLTKPNKYVVMCCQFSSYSICASILGDKKLMIFKNSLKSNLPVYKADISIIDE